MRVGIVCPYSFQAPGGVGNHIIDFAKEMAKRGHYISVLSPGVLPPELRSLEKPPNLKFISTGKSRNVSFNGSVAQVSFCTGTKKHIQKWLKDGRFDVIHLHQPDAPSLSREVLKVISKRAREHTIRPKVVATFHAAIKLPENPATRFIYKTFYKTLSRDFSSIDSFIAVSDEAKKTLLKSCGNFPKRFPRIQINIIPNGIFTREFSPENAVKRSSSKNTTQTAGEERSIIFLGRLDEPRKGFDVFLSALKIMFSKRTDNTLARKNACHNNGELLPAQKCDLHINVVGRTSKTLPELTKYVENVLGKGDINKVHFYSDVTNEQKVKLLRESDLLIAPQTGGESFGIVLIEAMAAGCAVLASDIKAFADVLCDEKAGTLFRTNDSYDLAKKTLYLFAENDIMRKKVEYAKEYVKRFDWSHVVDDVLEIYRSGINVTDTKTEKK
jgi:phosphatidylinositol alpha-mannosyltransferase